MSHQPSLPNIDAKVDFLSSSAAYPDYEGKVEVVETHMSWVFLTETRVYKLKKPSVRKMIDLSTQDARYHNCQIEVELNRRLGGDVYIGVEQLSVGPGGELKLGKGGVPVDWLVVMHRISEDNFLVAQIKAGEVNYPVLERAAKLLTDFYQRTPAVEMTAEQYRSRFEEGTADTHKSLCEYELSPEQLNLIRDRQLEFLRLKPSTLGERAEQGMVLEAHGDLRPEHLCLTEPPVVIDCLEFSRDLRILDRLDELAFLSIECECLDNFRVGEILFSQYTQLSGDHPPLALVAFYKSYRACIRAKLCAWHLDDVSEDEAAHWLGKAKTYLNMAERYTTLFDLH